MPVVIRTRTYGPQTYNEFSRGPNRPTRDPGPADDPTPTPETPEERLEREIAELF